MRSVQEAFTNVHKVFFLPPISDRESICDKIITAASKAHVHHVVLLSILGCNSKVQGKDYGSSFLREIGNIEKNLRTTALKYTILRPTFFQITPDFLRS